MPPKGSERRAPCNLYLPVALIDQLQEEADRQDLALSRLVERFLRQGMGLGNGAAPEPWGGPGKHKKPKPKPGPKAPHDDPHRVDRPRGEGSEPAAWRDKSYRSHLMALRNSPKYWAAAPKIRHQMEVDAAAADGEEGGHTWRQIDPLEEGGDGRLNERKAYQAGYRWLDEETGTLWCPDPDDRDQEGADAAEGEEPGGEPREETDGAQNDDTGGA